MDNFNIQDPAQWHLVLGGETLQFDSPLASRNLTLDVNTTARVDVYVSDNIEMKERTLVASSDGMFSCAVTVAGTCYIQMETNLGGQTYIRGKAPSQSVAPSETESFTSVMPRGRRNSDLDRMMRLVKHNENQREKMLSREIEIIRAERKQLRDAQLAQQSSEETVVEKPETEPAKAD